MKDVFDRDFRRLQERVMRPGIDAEALRLLEANADGLRDVLFKTIKPQFYLEKEKPDAEAHADRINGIDTPAGAMKIIFCVPRLYIQHINHSRGLRSRGHKTVLLCAWPLTTYGPPLEDIVEEFDYVCCTRYDYFILFDIIRRIQADVLYTVDYMNNNWFCALLHMLFGGGTVLEIYDLADNVGYPKEFSEKIVENSLGKSLYRLENQSRQYLYRRVNGLVYKDGEKAFERLRSRFELNGNTLKFHPYFCRKAWEGRQQRKLSDQDGRLHIVHSGFIPPHNPDAGRHLHHCLLDVARMLSDRKIHFHLYNPLDLDGTLLTDFSSLSAENEFVHYHRPVPMNDLPSTLSQYDFGWMVYDFSNRPAEGMERYEVAFSSRMLSYIAAGLPFFISKEYASMTASSSEWGVGVPMGYSDIPRIMEMVAGAKTDILRKNAGRARESLSMENHMDRLAPFLFRAADKVA